ncbi:hypothetical protein [Sinorhizobium medicae]|nr:hypothetical protein [Sinorhizobium medicae]
MIKGLERECERPDFLEHKLDALDRAQAMFAAKPIERQTEAIVAFAARKR